VVIVVVQGYTDYPFLQEIDKEPSKYEVVEGRGVKVYKALAAEVVAA
jgi:hypothetical protein